MADTNTNSLNRLMRPAEAASYLALSATTLRAKRAKGDGPPFVRLGRRVIRYRLADLDEWADAHVRERNGQ